MLLLLEARAKSVPGNYSIKGLVFTEEGTPGYSLTEAQMEKAKRMESQYYDWRSYEASISPNMEHPEYRSRADAASLVQHWEKILNELEPLPRGA